MAREISENNDYKDKLVKLIPTEIVGAYMVIAGILPDDASYSRWVTTVAALILLALTPLYLSKLYGVSDKWQITFTTASFIVWVYSLGGPFRLWDVYIPQIGSAGLILWTLLIPLAIQKGQVKIVEKPQKTKKADAGLIEWTPEMNSYLGKRARIIEQSEELPAVKLDVDKGQNWWATDWISKIN